MIGLGIIYLHRLMAENMKPVRAYVEAGGLAVKRQSHPTFALGFRAKIALVGEVNMNANLPFRHEVFDIKVMPVNISCRPHLDGHQACKPDKSGGGNERRCTSEKLSTGEFH